jgi:hypothetical protein
MQAETVLDTLEASSHAPSVTVISPNGGEHLGGPSSTLEWTATDLDGDPLEYVVQFSADGGASWSTLAVDWQDTYLDVSSETLTGTEQGLWRVLASDGLLTGMDVSDGVFSTDSHEPWAVIKSPTDASFYVGEQTVVLEGSARDVEDGEMSGHALVWSSDLDGDLGTGSLLELGAMSLTEGTHIITLVAKDTDAQTATESIAIDVHRVRPTLPSRLSAYPSTLSFMAVQGAPLTPRRQLVIRNLGDGDFDWTVERDQDWIQVSATEGSASTTVDVSANAGGLELGHYSGSLVVAAEGALDSPQTIQVQLDVIDGQLLYMPLLRHY